jgi:hypothetical protein
MSPPRRTNDYPIVTLFIGICIKVVRSGEPVS